MTPGPFFLVETVAGGLHADDAGERRRSRGRSLPGGSFLDNVFGNFRGVLTGTISGLKFLDANGNGVQDPGEGPQPGVTFTISGPDRLHAADGGDGRRRAVHLPDRSLRHLHGDGDGACGLPADAPRRLRERSPSR